MDIELIFRILLAGACGLIVGAERSRHHKTAGVRTYLIVAIGAAVYAMVSKYGFLDIVGTGEPHVDVSRVAAGIVTGVGFLGAGAIFMRENRVEGLGTSAGIWVMAAVGTAIGVGMYVTGFITTAIVFFVMVGFPKENFAGFKAVESGRLEICMDENADVLKTLETMLDEFHIDIVTTHIKRHKDHTITYSFAVNVPETLDTADAVSRIYRATNAKSIDL